MHAAGDRDDGVCVCACRYVCAHMLQDTCVALVAGDFANVYKCVFTHVHVYVYVTLDTFALLVA